MTLDILILITLILLNGLLVMAELAVVAARKARLKRRADEGSRGARIALALGEDPGRFLSTVQIGITGISTMLGALGGATLAEPLGAWLATSEWALARDHAEALSFAVVVLGITYASLILGELVPKRLALARPEALAVASAGPLRVLSRVAAPLVALLNASSNLVLLLFPGARGNDPSITDEEIRMLMRDGAAAGHFEEAERAIVDMTLRMGDRWVDALMTPRTQMEWLDVDDSAEENRRRILDSHYSRFPVKRGTSKNVEGFVQVKDLFADAISGGGSFDIVRALKPALYIPDTTPALKALETFRASGAPLALVVDEYGDIEGLITLTDLMEALVGDIRVPEAGEDDSVVQRDDGSWLIDGSFAADEVWDVIGLPPPLDADEADFNTVGGLMMHHLKRIPAAGDHFDLAGYRFEVVDMDGRRVDKVLIIPPAEEAANG
jgi:putative hemolysin